MPKRSQKPVGDCTYCFLDTNILIHCQTFDEVDWPGALGVADVCFVLAPVVLKELDKRKNESKHDWIQERARMLTKKLGTYLRDKRMSSAEPVPVRPHVTLLPLTIEPNIDWAELSE
jgi:hypothetical protein